MKHIKKVVTALTALAMLMPSALPIPVSAENTETVTITPSGGSGIKIIDPATGAEKTADIINKYGSDAWVIKRPEFSEIQADSAVGRLYFDIDDNFAHKVDDGSVFDFEIEYCAQQGVNGFWGMLNRDSNGFVELRYDSKITSTYTGNVFGTGQEGKRGTGIAEWKTAKMTVDNAYFDNALEPLDGEASGTVHGDFWLGARTAQNWFSSVLDNICYRDIYVRKISITKHSAQKPIMVNAEFNETGNTFEWYRDNKPVEITLKNTLNSSKTLTVECTATDQFDTATVSSSNEVTLAAKEEKTITVNIDTKYCGLYNYNIKVTSSDGTISSEYGPWRFAIVKTDENGVKNDKAYISTNMGHSGDVTATENTVKMAGKSNAGGIRTNMPFDYVYSPNSPGEFVENWTYGHLARAVRNENMKLLNIVSLYRDGVDTINSPGETLLTPEHSVAAKELANKYIKWLSEKYGDITKYYEIWNEPEGVAYDGTRCIDKDPEKYGQAYTDICHIFYDAIKKYNSDAKVIGGSMWLGTDNDIKAVESEYKSGIDNYTDMIGWHPYSTDVVYEERLPDFKDTLAKVNEIKNKYSERELGFASTEAGSTPMNVQGSYPHDHTYVQPCRNTYRQGNLNIRAYIEQMSIGSEIWTTYVFADPDRGTISGESTYGITECAMQRSPTPDGDSIIPKEAFLQETAKNYWLADADYESMQNINDNVYVAKFKSNKFGGKNIAVLWSKSDAEKVTLNLGKNNVIYSDGYGNEQELSSNNGRYTLYACDRPVYLIGDFEDVLIEQKVRKNANFKISLSGIVDGCGADEKLSVMVLPDGVKPTNENIDQIVYADQITTEAQGRYDYNLTVQNSGQKLRVYITPQNGEGHEFLVGAAESKNETNLFIQKKLEYKSPWYADPDWTYTDTYSYYSYAPYLYDLDKANYVFTDKSGEYLDTPIKVYYAFYKDGVLKDIKVETAEENLGGEIIYSPPKIADKDYDSTAFFIWKDGTGLVPIGEPVRVKK